MSTSTERCEACRRNIVEVLVDDDAEEDVSLQPYRVCAACARRLRSCALRPLEWFNLAAIHGPFKPLLHDDMYEEDGTALQPAEAVQQPQKYPAPALEQASPDRERLLDYAMTRYFLDAPT